MGISIYKKVCCIYHAKVCLVPIKKIYESLLRYKFYVIDTAFNLSWRKILCSLVFIPFPSSLFYSAFSLQRDPLCGTLLSQELSAGHFTSIYLIYGSISSLNILGLRSYSLLVFIYLLNFITLSVFSYPGFSDPTPCRASVLRFIRRSYLSISCIVASHA